MLRVCCVIALAAVPICFGGDLIIRSSFSGKIDHKRFAFTITHADVAKTPAWSPGAKRPNGGEQDQFNVPVFMDGRVVKPRVFLID